MRLLLILVLIFQPEGAHGTKEKDSRAGKREKETGR
jgi:hypothetical protein